MTSGPLKVIGPVLPMPSSLRQGYKLRDLDPDFERLAAVARGEPWLRAVNVGLSNRAGEIAVQWNHMHDSANSITQRVGHELFATDVETARAK